MNGSPSDMLEIKDLHCGYGGRPVVADFSLCMDGRGVDCLLGPNGCGKTTVLRAVAGFEPVIGGEIRLGGRLLSGPGFTLPPERRGIGMVFQDYALFPHLSVADNVGFGLRHGPWGHRSEGHGLRGGGPKDHGSKGDGLHSRSGRRRAVAEMLELVGLSHCASRYPHELSGGEQQRVAVARALAPSPALLLMDEPFSNLDVEARERLLLDVREILQRRGTATLFVTHDQQEAFIIGSQIAVMNGGRILQRDTPYRLYHEPACRFVADFIGPGRLLPGKVGEDQTSVITALGELRGDVSDDTAEGGTGDGGLGHWPPGTEVDVLLRPDDVLLDAADGIECLITDRHFKGAQIMYTLQTPDGTELLSLVGSHLNRPIGEKIKAHTAPKHLVTFRR